MRTTRELVHGRHCVVRSVECTDDHAGWSPPEATSTPRIVLVRRGRFRLESRGRRVTVDPTSGYLHGPGDETRFSHPAGGDVCTSVSLPDDVLADAFDAVRTMAVRVDARLELAHRRLVRTGADPEHAGVEAVVDLLGLALRTHRDDVPAPGRRDLADRARDAVLAGVPEGSGLVPLARLLGTSPAHLSRTFRHHIGMPISRYRNRIRVSQAMQHIGDGETDLAGLSLTLGFSDQAHFTRTVRRELGHTPGSLRVLLGPARD